jgi:plasmid stabilization system protein ParE
MSFQVEISSVAKAEADAAFLQISQLTSVPQGKAWYSGLLTAIDSLSVMPSRCPLARENQYFSQEIRQLLYGRGKNTYRVLFTILDSETISTVRILRIRYGSQQTIGEAPKQDDELK